jgi:myo-inositol 2-dehydrogenase/D-chiro-inositol 1-dehydrogenase
MVRMGILGAGRIGTVHARTLRDSPDVDSVVITDVDQARAHAVVSEVGGLSAASSVGEVLGGVDAVVIAAATSAHAQLVHEAADAGLAIFCEKPISLEIDETRAVIDHVDRAGVPLQIGFQRRFDAGYRAAHDLVAAGGLGTIYLVRAAGHDPEPPHEAYIPTSGGLFKDFSVHDFDAIRFVTGQEFVEVYADGSVVGFPVFAKYDDIDTGVATFRLSEGSMGVLTVNRHDPLGYDIRMELVGSGDAVAVGLDERTPLRSLEPGVRPPASSPANFQERFRPAYEAEMRAFVDLVAGRIASPCTGEDALAALLVAEACDRSRRERRPVTVKEVA